MMAEAEERVPAGAPRPTPQARGHSASAAVRVLGILIAAACALFVSNNWCFVLFPAALAALLSDHAVCAIRPWFVLRVPVAAAVGVAVGMLLGVGPEWAFREALGSAPPNGVRDVRIWRHYLGGPGEHALIIEFTADVAAFQALVQAHPPLPDSHKVTRWREAGGGWGQAFDIFVGSGVTSFARASWQRIRPLERPEALDLGESNRGSLVLFHEPGTGRCVALHVRF